MSKLWWAIRAWSCEVLVGWSLAVRPKGYVPSYVELLVQAHKKNSNVCE